MSALVRDSNHFHCLWLLACRSLLENSDRWTVLASSRSFCIKTLTESGKSSQLSSAKSKEMQQNHISIPSSVIFQFLCCLESLFLIFSLEGAAWMTHFFFSLMISYLSVLCLSIGSLSGCLCQTPSCVCWMVCNYPQESLEQSFKVPLQICCSIHGWTSVLREQREEREHTENENYT